MYRGQSGFCSWIHWIFWNILSPTSASLCSPSPPLFHHYTFCPSPPQRPPLPSEIFLLLISPCVSPALLVWFPLKSPLSPPASSSCPSSSSSLLLLPPPTPSFSSFEFAASLTTSGRTNLESVESELTDVLTSTSVNWFPVWGATPRFHWNVSPASQLTWDWVCGGDNISGVPSHSCLHFTLD